jgi:hypothetical protein
VVRWLNVNVLLRDHWANFLVLGSNGILFLWSLRLGHACVQCYCLSYSWNRFWYTRSYRRVFFTLIYVLVWSRINSRKLRCYWYENIFNWNWLSSLWKFFDWVLNFVHPYYLFCCSYHTVAFVSYDGLMDAINF